MNKLFLLIILLNFCFISCDKSTGPNSTPLQFAKTFDGGSDDGGKSVDQTEDGGYIITGFTRTEENSNDIWFIKTDIEGNEQWNKTFGGNSSDQGNSVQQTTDGGYVITGRFAGGSGILIKTDPEGNEEWNKSYGEGQCQSVQQTTDGGYILVSSEFDMFSSLIKTDPNGNEEWIVSFCEGYLTVFYSVDQTEDGGYIVIGYRQSFDHHIGALLIKVDPQGNEQWKQTFDNYDCGFASGQQTTDGGYIFTGGIGSAVLLIKTDHLGSEQWRQTFGQNYLGSGRCIQQTMDEGYIITGRTKTGYNDFFNILLIKTDFDGNLEWEQSYGDIGDDMGYSVQQTTDGGYIITGETFSLGSDSFFDVWLIKTDSNGITVPLEK